MIELLRGRIGPADSLPINIVEYHGKIKWDLPFFAQAGPVRGLRGGASGHAEAGEKKMRKRD